MGKSRNNAIFTIFSSNVPECFSRNNDGLYKTHGRINCLVCYIINNVCQVNAAKCS